VRARAERKRTRPTAGGPEGALRVVTRHLLCPMDGQGGQTSPSAFSPVAIPGLALIVRSGVTRTAEADAAADDTSIRMRGNGCIVPVGVEVRDDGTASDAERSTASQPS
jgi:hypothetical protein